MDNVWRLENYYISDAQSEECHSLRALTEILADEKKHIELLRQEVARRCVAEKFD
jgi:hypothetical protein